MPSVSTNTDYSELFKKQEKEAQEIKLEQPKQEDIKQDNKKIKGE